MKNKLKKHNDYFLQNNMYTASALIALIYLFLSGLFVFFSVPVHFNFYKNYFEHKKSISFCIKTLKEYISSIFFHVLLMSPLILLVAIISFEEIQISIIVFILLLSEKLFDEIQRFLLFSKKFIIWSNIFLFKTIIPLILSFVIYFLIPFETSLIISYVIFTIICNALIAKKFVPNIFFKILRNLLKKSRLNIISYTKKFKSIYFQKFIVGICRINVLNSDKWFINFLNLPQLLGEIMLISQMGNMVSLNSNYMFISNRRSELLNSKNNLDSLWLGLKVPLINIFVSCIIIIIIISLISFDLINIKILPMLSIILLIGSYAIFSITDPIYENIFWNFNSYILLIIEVVFYSSMFLLGYIFYTFLEIEYISIALFISISIRALLQIGFIKLKKKSNF